MTQRQSSNCHWNQKVFCFIYLLVYIDNCLIHLFITYCLKQTLQQSRTILTRAWIFENSKILKELNHSYRCKDEFKEPKTWEKRWLVILDKLLGEAAGSFEQLKIGDLNVQFLMRDSKFLKWRIWTPIGNKTEGFWNLRKKVVHVHLLMSYVMRWVVIQWFWKVTQVYSKTVNASVEMHLVRFFAENIFLSCQVYGEDKHVLYKQPGSQCNCNSSSLTFQTPL